MNHADAVTELGVGLDTARYGHHVTFLRQDLQFAAEPFGFSESQEGYQELRAAFEELAQRHGRVHFHIRIDAAGQYAVNLTQFLQRLDFAKTISIGEPKRNKDYRSVHFPKRKADAVDSHACARFAMVERPAATPIVPREFLELREVLSALQSQTKRTTRLVNQMHNRLSRAFPELATLVKNLGAQWVLKLLQKYPTSQRIAAARLSSLAAIPYVTAEKAKSLHQAAKASTASLSGLVVEDLVSQLAREIAESQKHEKNLEKLLEKAFDALPPGNHVQVASIPGIGKLTAAALVANMVSIDRFDGADSVVNFYGVFPEENTSGLDRRGRAIPPGTMQMCQKGNDLIRQLLYMSCLGAIRTNPAIRALYARKRAENKRGDVSLGHCMRKMLHLVFAVWKTGKPFDSQHYPWAQPGAEPTDAATADDPRQTPDRPQQETAAGRKEQGSNRKAVTATAFSVLRTEGAGKVATSTKPSAANPSFGTIDYTVLRQQVSIEQALGSLGHLRLLRGTAAQQRGPCPIHKSQRDTSRSFSVNFDKNVFQCFAPACGAKGNVLDLWAAIHKIPIHAAAQHLAATFHIALPQKKGHREEEPVNRQPPNSLKHQHKQKRRHHA